MAIFSILNLLIFILIALLHVYWAFGGKWGLGAVIPEFENGQTVFKAPPIATIIVAIGLFGFALIHASTLGIFSFLTTYYLRISLLIISSIFMLRAIGDFKYVGLFKKQKKGAFAENDTRYYVPLCFLISFNGLITYYLF